jgi:hypothetical protein
MRSWLAEHPTGPGRASVLTWLGRLDEAAVAIEQIETTTPEEAFGVDIMRATTRLLAGRAADPAPLHARWTALPDARERRHRRECLALLDAQIAVLDGQDPIPVVAAGRREIGEVHPSMRIERLLARWSLAGLAIVLISTAVAAILVRPQAISG